MSTESAFGIPAAAYVGVEVRATARLGAWTVGGSYDFLARGGDPDEHRLFASVETEGRFRYGFGIRTSLYDRAPVASETTLLGYLGW
jgi:hypothetical protein